MFFSRLSRQTSSSSPEPPTTTHADDSSPHSPHSEPSPAQGRASEASEGYPSWLPRRPPHPPPASSVAQSESGNGNGNNGNGAGEPQTPGEPSIPAGVGGRKATPRSIRVISLKDPNAGNASTPTSGHNQRKATDATRVPSHHRVWSRATRPTIPMSPTAIDPSIRPVRPKFRAPGLNLELLRDPSPWSYLYFCLYPFLVFGHIALQLFFDFNAVFIIFQVSRYPDPLAPGVPGSGRNWHLGAAAYIASIIVWIFGVFIAYEVIYSFARRWRLKRPLILPIYMSAPAYKLAGLTSYSRFCFLHHLRWSAFHQSVRQGLSETFYFYSQNLPTVALLLPRAGLSLALLFAFSSPKPTTLALAATGRLQRDNTFFRSADGTLTSYARGVLIANATWTAWRILVLLVSWVGLWVLSGHSCAGLCGPRSRWEEEEANEKKRMSIYSTADSDIALEWDWKEETRARIQDSYEFCLTVKRSKSTRSEKNSPREVGFDGIEKVMAAVGLGGNQGDQSPVQVRRNVMSNDFFERDMTEVVGQSRGGEEMASPSPKDPNGKAGDNKLLYPFTMTGAQVSSKDTVPFPPSPHPSGGKQSTHEGDEDEDGEEDGEDGDEEYSSPGRTSGSMSSLGQPVNSRYPFQFRKPGQRASLSSGVTYMTPSSRSTPSSNAHPSSPSTGDRSSDSHAHALGMASMSSPSRYTTRSDVSSSGGTGVGVIPMPPRRGRGRARAGTVPAPISTGLQDPSSVLPPFVGVRANRMSTRTRGDSTTTEGLSSIWGMPDSSVDMSEALETSGETDADGDAEGLELSMEHEDILGLLSESPSSSSHHHGSGLGNLSPKSSLGALRQAAARSRRGSSRTNSQSSSSNGGVGPGQRSRHGSFVSSARSRAQSLVQSMSRHSSTVDLAKIREHGSMSRLEEEYLSSSSQGHGPRQPQQTRQYGHRPGYVSGFQSGHSRSESSDGAFLSGSEHNYTFGQPLPNTTPAAVNIRRAPAAAAVEADAVSRVEEAEEESSSSSSSSKSRKSNESPRGSHESQERRSLAISENTVSPHHLRQDSQLETIHDHEQTAAKGSSPIPIPVSPTRSTYATQDAPYRQDKGKEKMMDLSPPDISTAAQSFVTAPATIDGTTDSSSALGVGTSWGGGIEVDRPFTMMGPGGGPGGTWGQV